VRRFAGLGVGLLLALFTGACATLETRGDGSYEGARTYSGAQRSVSRIGQGLINLNIPLAVIGLFDLPFSFLADTALLPITIPEENARQRKISQRMQTQRETSTGVRSEPEVSLVETARSLFETCISRLEGLDPSVADCYSIEARVVIVDPSSPVSGDAAEFSGAEYKGRIRDTLRRARAAGSYLTYRNVSYELEAPNVRVRALRASSDWPTSRPVTFRLGPGADGEWRILEERGLGWR
jgi:uncharacterized protein YceK